MRNTQIPGYKRKSVCLYIETQITKAAIPSGLYVVTEYWSWIPFKLPDKYLEGIEFYGVDLAVEFEALIVSGY